SKQVTNDADNPDWRQGYGFQFWRGRHNTYRADGAFGQFILAFPEYDAVLVTTSATGDMQAILNTAWDYLLPALEGKEVPATPRPERLELPPPSGAAPAPGDGQTYHFADRNPAGLTAVRLDADGTGTFTFEDPRGGTHEIVCAAGGWREQAAPGTVDDAGPETGERILTSAYGDGDAFVATFRWVETPFVATLACRVDGGAMTVDGTLNVSFGPTTFSMTSQT
ncbi:MAG TPA: serine hydrolase, partial [Kribbella sp.]|nr:serine hydrolase [Kribbella sp.]